MCRLLLYGDEYNNNVYTRVYTHFINTEVSAAASKAPSSVNRRALRDVFILFIFYGQRMFLNMESYARRRSRSTATHPLYNTYAMVS